MFLLTVAAVIILGFLFKRWCLFHFHIPLQLQSLTFLWFCNATQFIGMRRPNRNIFFFCYKKPCSNAVIYPSYGSESSFWN